MLRSSGTYCGDVPPVIQLDMIRPMKAQNTVEFTLAFNRGATDVTWSMKGKSAFGIPA